MAASNLGGWIARSIGPHLAKSRKAKENLIKSFPDKTDQECKDIIRGMWDNLGRIMGEYPHLKDIIMNYTDIVGMEHLEGVGKNNPCIIIGAHIANWELLPFFFKYRLKWPMSGVFREPNNPYVARLLDKCRYMDENKDIYIRKSSAGARKMVKTLQDGGKLGMIIDQRYNKGLPVPFLGRLAMTGDGFAQLAFKYNVPVIPIVAERINGCHYRMVIHPKLELAGDDYYETTRRANVVMEEWIKKYPQQWLWIHDRWNSKALRNIQQ